MLDNLYQFVTQDGINKYYILDADDLYLATESVVTVDDKEVQQGLKLLELDLPTLVLLVAFAESPVDIEDPDGLDTRYKVLDVPTFQARVSDLFDKAKEKGVDVSNYSLVNDYDNKVIKAFVAEENPILWVEKLNSHTERVTLLGLTSNGVLVLFHVKAVIYGDGTREVFDVNRFTYSLDTVKAIVQKFKDKENKEDMN